MDVLAVVHLNPVDGEGRRLAADEPASVHQHNIAAPVGETARGRKPGEPGADDDDAHQVRAPPLELVAVARAARGRAARTSTAALWERVSDSRRCRGISGCCSISARIRWYSPAMVRTQIPAR